MFFLAQNQNSFFNGSEPEFYYSRIGFRIYCFSEDPSFSHRSVPGQGNIHSGILKPVQK